jgi:endonuclease/exonuclease/phosphatase family metal-dependent hydrolase
MLLRSVTRGAAALILITLAGCENDINTFAPVPTPSMSAHGADHPVVMTRNLYLGADLTPIIGISDVSALPFVAAEVWGMVQATNFPARAGALADEIVRARPHLVGLQEAALYRRQSPGDAVLGGTTAATTVVYDFVELLLDSLRARGAEYTAAAINVSTDVEVPAYTGSGPLPFDDIRFTLRDAVLVRGDVAWSNPRGDIYAARLDFPVGGPGGPEVSMRRGWASVDAMLQGRELRFFSTHFEVQRFAPIQLLQAQELIGLVQASPLPVVVVGDFNSAADGSQTATYGLLTAAGLRDLWDPSASPGHTCCQDEDLTNHLSVLDQRLDIIFVRGFDLASFRAGGEVKIVGNRPAARLPDGLWPSDHAGLVGRLRLAPQ